MEELSTKIFTAFALIFVIEGLLYAVFPSHIQKVMTMASDMDPEKLRSFGAAMIALGALIIWLIYKL